MKGLRLALVYLAPVLVASAFRFPELALRPMHCDEAVNADKSGTLLEEGRYEYNPVEFHGPTLHYLALLSAHLRGQANYKALDEVTLRSVPAVAGIALVGAHVLLTPFIGVAGAVIAALLAAISPAMVYYSRYYIHETLLVFFTFGALVSACRYLRKPRAGWAILTGICLGLMHATKETAAIVLVAILLALVATLLFERRPEAKSPPLRTVASPTHLVMVLISAILVSGLFYSSFMSNWKGIVDSLWTYRFYFERATTATFHVHAWDYYLGLLLYSHKQGGPVWTEGLIFALAIPGFVAAWSRTGIPGVNQRLLRFLSWYTLFMIVFYSAIPHKTPWCLLGFLHGLVLLAGVGAVQLVRALKKTAVRVPACILLFVAAGNLAWQAWAGSFRYEADPINPYVYAHTGKDVFLIVRRIEELTRADPRGPAMPIQIISRENLWPLPWYFRRLSGVQWWNGVSDTAPKAPLILATPDMEPALTRRLYEVPPPGERDLYMNIFERPVYLRPQVELRAYAVKWLWDDYSRLEANTTSPSRPQP